MDVILQVKVDAWAGKYLFVYLTPELAVQSIAALQRLHQQRGICLVAVDEAHCVSGVYRPTQRNTAMHHTSSVIHKPNL